MELHELSGLELGAKVRSKEVSVSEVLDHFEKRITEKDPKLHAFTYTAFEEARKAGEKIQADIMEGYGGPLAGVPVGLKDFLPSKKGWKNSHGGVEALQQIDDADSEFCKAVESAGAIVVGKTNAPAFGFRGVTDNHMYGPTSTPFDVSRNSGGSSGGSASAVGGGLLAAAEGGDAGGSIRIPSAWCGCFGFKPSAGLVPSVCRPDAWTATHPYCCGGPITRTVEDAAMILSYMTKYDPRDPLSVPLPYSATDFLGVKRRVNSTSKPLSGMRVAITHNFDLFPDPESEIAETIDRVARILVKAGAIVTTPKFKFNYSLEEYESAWLRSISIDSSIDLELAKQNGFDLIKEHPEQLPIPFMEWNDIAISSTMLDYRKFHEIRTDVLDAHQDIFDRFDIIFAPVAGCSPVKNRVEVGELDRGDDGLTHGPSEINGAHVDNLIGFSYTFLENFIGTPAASVPGGLTSDNLPVGVQVIANRYRDIDVFKVAYVLERDNPWNYNIPFNI